MNAWFRRSAKLIAIVSAAACGADQREATTRQLRLEPLPTGTALDVLQFPASGGPAWLDDSTLVLLDRDEEQLVALDLAAGEVRRGGRKGAGPGEMENGIAVAARATGGVMVLDMRLNRAIEFDSDLAFTRSQPVPGMPLSVLSADANALRALWMTFRPEGPDPRMGTIDMVSGDVGTVVRIFETSGLERPETSSPFEPLFVSAVVTRKGGVAVGIGNEYRIVELDDAGSIRATFGRPELEARPLTAERMAARREHDGDRSVRAGRPLRPDRRVEGPRRRPLVPRRSPCRSRDANARGHRGLQRHRSLSYHEPARVVVTGQR